MAGDPEAGASKPRSRHRLSRERFDALAAGGSDQETISHLSAGERSWRLVMLRAVLDAAAAEPNPTGPLPPLSQAWQLLVRAERRAPEAVARVLYAPAIGAWAGYTLRRLRRSLAAESPLWIDVGYLHSLAAAAAIEAGLPFQIRVPVRDGVMALPTLGVAELPGCSGWQWAAVSGTGTAGVGVVRVAGGELRVPDSVGWHCPPVVRVGAGGAVLEVSLDSLDPYRNLRTPAPPQPLSRERLARWRQLLAQAWQLLVKACPQLAPAVAAGLSTLVPQPAVERFRPMSASAGDAFGSAIVSDPADPVELAVTLVHEFQHIKLGALLHLTPLQDGEPVERLYAPWRDDPRPLGGLLQGVYAFTGITSFWCALRRVATGDTGRLAHFEFARWRTEVATTLRTLRSLPQLTEAGRRLVAGLTTTAEQWHDEPVPAGLRAAAAAAVSDHRGLWRLHHLRPAPRVVDELAAGWRAGTGPPRVSDYQPAVVPDESVRRLDTRAVLALWRLTDPAGFAEIHRAPAAVGDRVADATAADLAYVAGELAHARELYLAELRAVPQRVSAWAGLGLVLAAGWPGPAAEALRQRPELVRAVHHRVRAATGGPVDPIAVAGWLGAAPVTGGGAASIR